MSIVVVPGQFHAAPHPAGKLASTLLSVQVAGIADPGRFRRGKRYVTEHAVHRLEIEPGTLTATVSGSEPRPYRVVVSCNLIPAPESTAADALRLQLARLTPDASDMFASCTCMDDDDFCKHVVAALLALSGELVNRPELLVQWRCAPAGEAVRTKVGSRARPAGERHLRLAPPLAERAAETSPWETQEWRSFLGAMPPAPPEAPAAPVSIGRAMVGAIDLATIVRDALATLRGDDPDQPGTIP
ncbi:MAG: SWIM zinc finger family protein [Ilumatobacteraceae bacterium]